MPLRMEAHHEGLDDAPAAAVAGRDDGLCFNGIEGDWLLAEHVLAGLECLHRPFDVQVVGQRVVDRLDLRIVEQCLIAAVAARNAEARGDVAGPLGIARGNGRDDAALARENGRDDALDADVRGTENSPDHLAHVFPSELGRIIPSAIKRFGSPPAGTCMVKA